MRPPVWLDKIRFIAKVIALRSHDRWSRERLARHQTRAFEELRQFALARSPFYRRLYKGLETAPLESLPPVSKRELMANFDEAVTDRQIKRTDVAAFAATMNVTDRFHNRYHVVETSGTTGEKGYFLYDPSEWRTMLASSGRVTSWAYRERPGGGDRFAMMTTEVPRHMSPRMGAEVRRLGLMPEQQTIDSGVPVADVVARLNAFKPTILTIYPSILQVLAGEQAAGRLKIAPRRIQCSSEVFTAAARDAAVRAFGVEPSNAYAASECGTLGGTCHEGPRMHLAQDTLIVECVDERGRPVPTGETGAKVLLTVLYGRTLPLIRYELNDRLTLSAEPCACGRPFVCVSEIGGRTGDMMEFAARAGGTIQISPMQLDDVLIGLPLSGWQFVAGPDALEVDCIATTDVFPESEIVARIGAALDAQGVVQPVIRARRIDKLARGATGKTIAVAKNVPSA